MMARGFKPVGWVAAVAGAALGCYMLSLNVASERADLAKIDRQIIAAKQDIRSLQIELGTRGRMAQLETWNAEVLALSAPATGQFLEDELKLARFDQRAPTLDERANLRLASAEAGAPVPPPIAAPVVEASALAPAPVQPTLAGGAMVHQASLAVPAARPQPLEARLVPDKLAQPTRALSSKVAPRKAQAASVDQPAAGRDSVAVPIRISAKLVREISTAAKLEAGPGGR